MNREFMESLAGDQGAAYRDHFRRMDWERARRTCKKCHGKGTLRASVFTPLVILHETNGVLYRPGHMIVGDCFYSGYVEVKSSDYREGGPLAPRTKEVVCDHGLDWTGEPKP